MCIIKKKTVRGFVFFSFFLSVRVRSGFALEMSDEKFEKVGDLGILWGVKPEHTPNELIII